jgi:hypothetical protein
MTREPTVEELAERQLLNPSRGKMHLNDLMNQVKDGIYAKDFISDHVIGILLLGLWVGLLSEWEVMLFQLPFTNPDNIKNGMTFRKNYNNYGNPFFGPDGRILTLHGRYLCGDDDSGVGASDLDLDGIRNHPEFENWVKSTLFAGGEPTDSTYARVRALKDTNTKKKCDDYINSRTYTPGPLSVDFEH